MRNVSKQKRFTLILLLCITPNDIKPMAAAAAQLAWWAIKSEAVRQLCKVVPGLAAAVAIKNIADVTNGLAPSVDISQQAMDALKKAGHIPHIVQPAVVGVAQAPASDTVKNAIANLKMQQCAINTIAAGPLINVPGQTNVFGAFGPSNIHWNSGRNAFHAMNAKLINSVGSVPKVSEYFGVTVSVDGKTAIINVGRSAITLNISTGTSAHSHLLDVMNGIHRQRVDRIFIYKALDSMGPVVSQAQQIAASVKPILGSLETGLIEIINTSPTLIQSMNLSVELNAVGQFCQAQMTTVEMLYKQGQISAIEASGLYSLYEEAARTAQNIQGALCDTSGNLIGLRTAGQKEVLARVLQGHCERFGYSREAVAQQLARITDPVASRIIDTRVLVPRVFNTEFNRDLRIAFNNMQAGRPEFAGAIIEKYNPANYSRLSNWWHNRHVLYDTMQSAYQESLQTWYNAEGVLSVYENHPLWHELSTTIRDNPGLRNDIINKLQNEHAYSLQELGRIGIADPTPDQMATMYQLCQYSDLKRFDGVIAQMAQPGDLGHALQECVQECQTFQAIRESINCPDELWHDLMRHQELLKAISCDPHFNTVMTSLIQNPSLLPDVLNGLSARLDAAQALLNRCGITNPCSLTRALSYQLLDNYHDVPRMLDILSELNPQHADALVSQAYHDFFDAQGIQRVLPIDPQMRALLSERLGHTINVTQDGMLRNACNRFALINIKNPESLAVVERGFGYIEQAQIAGPHTDFLRDYTSRFTQALINPQVDNLRALSVGHLVDVFLQPMPDSIRQPFADLLSQVIDTSSQFPLHPDLAQQVVDRLGNIAGHIGRNDFEAARRGMQAITQLRLSAGTPEILNDAMPSMFSQPEPTCSSSVKETARDAAVTAAFSEIARNGFPISSSSQPLQSQNQGQAAKDAMRRLLRDRLIKFAEAKKRHDSLPALARELLSDGEVIAATAEGVVVELPHDIFAHVSRDGSVDMMAPQCGQAQNFAADIQELVQRIGEERLTRSSVLDAARAAHVDMQSYVPEATASSSNDVGESESLGDVIAHLAKEHAKRAQQSSSRASLSAGGGAPPPNDPRNNRNINNGRSQFEKETIEERKERLSRGVAPVQKKECINIVEQMGFVRIKEVSHGNAIFRNGRIYISFDADNHNGGVWKMADSVNNLKSRATRMGTYDKLLRRIGD